ncbi:hypothetical protein LTR97_009222 [Elasticomyces elasticus]|uniref:Uncharacterized protein n=1 Tax=Elasticomyces elasticus TaxID=574655 RepID=A0AAN7W262_9PEZI|nr:hypothetical protein LTR97_009222 [Elasticomyces elasticus]
MDNRYANSCRCSPSCHGVMDPSHVPTQEEFNYWTLGIAGWPKPAQDFTHPASYCGVPESELYVVMINVIDYVLCRLNESFGAEQGWSLQYETTANTLLKMRGLFYAGTITVPAVLSAAGPENNLRMAAALEEVARVMQKVLDQFKETDVYVQQTIDAMLEWASRKRAGGPPGQQIDRSSQEDADTETSKDAAEASSSAPPARPSLSILQPVKDANSNVINEPLQSMALVPTVASTVITIGSGTDAIDHLDVRNLGIDGVESVKVMHPLQQANLAKHHRMLLYDLYETLDARLLRGRYGPAGRPDHEAVASSMEALHDELERRNMPVPKSSKGLQASFYGTQGYGSRPTRSTSVQSGIRQPSFGGSSYGPSTSGSYYQEGYGSANNRTPSMHTQRTPSYGPQRWTSSTPSYVPYRPTSSYGTECYGPSSRPGQPGLIWPQGVRPPSASTPMPLSARQGSRMPSMPVVSSDYFSERRTIGNGDLSEPVSLNNVEIEIKHPLTSGDLPAGLGQRDILELKVRLEHQNRRVHIDDLVKRAVAARYRARKESIAAIDAWLAQEQVVKDSLAEDAANKAGDADDTEDLCADEAGSSEKAKGKRAHGSYIPSRSPSRDRSFLDARGLVDALVPNVAETGMSAEMGLVFKERMVSYLQMAEQMGDTTMLEHAEAALAARMETGATDDSDNNVVSPETPQSPHTESPSAPTQLDEHQGEDSLAEEARAATQLHQKSEQAAASTVDLQSNIADDGSDIGNLDDVKSDTTDLATSASLSGSDVKVDTSADDEHEDGKKKSPTISEPVAC